MIFHPFAAASRCFSVVLQTQLSYQSSICWFYSFSKPKQVLGLHVRPSVCLSAAGVAGTMKLSYESGTCSPRKMSDSQLLQNVESCHVFLQKLVTLLNVIVKLITHLQDKGRCLNSNSWWHTPVVPALWEAEA